MSDKSTGRGVRDGGRKKGEGKEGEERREENDVAGTCSYVPLLKMCSKTFITCLESFF